MLQRCCGFILKIYFQNSSQAITKQTNNHAGEGVRCCQIIMFCGNLFFFEIMTEYKTTEMNHKAKLRLQNDRKKNIFNSHCYIQSRFYWMFPRSKFSDERFFKRKFFALINNRVKKDGNDEEEGGGGKRFQSNWVMRQRCIKTKHRYYDLWSLVIQMWFSPD